ncbi:MAG: glycoside hydrolase family 2 TIM barrel-domain containing protein, partial [Phycisphaeraceae bacterium]
PARLYYHADRMGLLVWQDMPNPMLAGQQGRHYVGPDDPEDATFTPQERLQFHAELREMIDSLYNHPSIVVWVPFNEGWGQHETNEVLAWVMDYDPTRLVGGPSGWIDRGVGHLKDMHSYPGPSMFPAMDDRISVLGEFGGLGWPVEGHLWQPDQNWGYRTYHSQDELREHYTELMEQLPAMIGEGLAAAVYTQTTDVEIEVNGLVTYDRRRVKLPVDELAELHAPLYAPPPVLRTLVPTGDQEPQAWRYTTDEPAEDWYEADFDASDWATGESGFGTEDTPNTTVRTEWDTSEIWIRRAFVLDEEPADDEKMLLRLFHDEDTQVYINGVLAAELTGWTSRYVLVSIRDQARQALREGRNTIAIRCEQTDGGQYIDAGLVKIQSRDVSVLERQ